MALSNSQYDRLMRTYEERQLDNERRLLRRYEEAYARIPLLRELDGELASLSVTKAKGLLGGDDGALPAFRERAAALRARKLALLKENGLPEDYLEPHYTCPDCRDTGYIGTERCHCLKKAMIDLLYSQSNLGEILKKENFSTFSMDYYSAGHIDSLGRSSRESAEIALKVCREFADRFSEHSDNLLLYGDVGVGKTFLSHCIAKELIEACYSVIYFSASQLFNLLAREVFGRKTEEEDGTLSHIYDCDLLIIDDLGTEMSNSFTVSQLFVCLNERILRKKSTVISTNLALEDLRDTYFARIFSRISSNYTMLKLTGDDIRLQKKLLNLGGITDAAT